jgi:hypothetical protein
MTEFTESHAMKHETTSDPTESLPAALSRISSSDLGSFLLKLMALTVQQPPAPALRPEPLPLPGRWKTPPKASALSGLPVKAIRTMIVNRTISFRLRNCSAEPKQPKYLVNVDEVIAAATFEAGLRAPHRHSATAPNASTSTSPTWAEQKLARSSSSR